MKKLQPDDLCRGAVAVRARRLFLSDCRHFQMLMDGANKAENGFENANCP